MVVSRLVARRTTAARFSHAYVRQLGESLSYVKVAYRLRGALLTEKAVQITLVLLARCREMTAPLLRKAPRREGLTYSVLRTFKVLAHIVLLGIIEIRILAAGS
ncbi:hypothetical protein [Sphingomonas sp. 2SG]|uniref:hypothetical protein n=1 Tax=Sphingomonas sp. 2SG TaxID=2502201 RepID=UPI0010F57E87|nr:hypothetical protein [Sphingomonas sp. 2SG]